MLIVVTTFKLTIIVYGSTFILEKKCFVEGFGLCIFGEEALWDCNHSYEAYIVCLTGFTPALATCISMHHPKQNGI